VHATADDRPTLVHVDAYRLSGPGELDDLDLDLSAPTSVTVVEWGKGLVEQAWDDRLEIDLLHDPEGGRLALVRPVGDRWSSVDLSDLAEVGRRRAHGEAVGA
jgi:tRNA threonylcarbamoyladenosine biosynthesis protein TsaE